MDTADVVQETFLRAYTRLGQTQRLDVFRAWVCRIAWSSSLDTLRRRSREAPADKEDIWAGLPAEEDLHAATERALDAQRMLARRWAFCRIRCARRW